MIALTKPRVTRDTQDNIIAGPSGRVCRATTPSGAVGVTTGIYTEEQLRSVAPGATVLDGLADQPVVLRALGLE